MHRIAKFSVSSGRLVATSCRKSCRLLLRDLSPKIVSCNVQLRLQNDSFSEVPKRSYSLVSYADIERRYIPRRTLMYIPGHDMKKLKKVPNLGVDCAVLECEDGVALHKKAEARENIRVMLDELGHVPDVDIAVRVNSVSSGLLDQDLQVIMRAQHRPETILLPKVDSVDDLVVFTHRLRAAVDDQDPDYCPHLITYVESAEGLMNMKDVLRRAENFSKEGVYHLDGVVFGSDDFCADIGAMRTVDASELTYARQKIVMVARAYRIQAIDMVFIDYKDQEGLRIQSEQGARKGYTGKQIIHPNQVATVRDAFTPSPGRVKWATELIKAFEHHQQSGQGAFTFEGNMIDRPLLLQAKNVLQTVQNVEKAA